MNVLVFDTETSNKSTKSFNRYGNMIMNIGGCFIDADKREKLEDFNFLIEEIYDNKSIMENFYFKDRMENFEKIKKVKFQESLDYISSKLEKYKVTDIYAYNINFDKQALEDTIKFLNASFDTEKYFFKDIYAMACDMASRVKDDYAIFCQENDRISAAGNFLTNAETMYAFLTNTPNYEEEHTALEDSKIESDIYFKCLDFEKQNNYTLKRKPYSFCWKWVQM